MNSIKYLIPVLVLFLSGCLFDNTDDPTSLDEPPFIVGEVTDFSEGLYANSILVEEDREVTEPAEPGGKKMWFIVNDETEILKRSGSGSLIKFNIDQIEAGHKVEGWERGIVEQSQPTRGLAKRIVVIE